MQARLRRLLSSLLLVATLSGLGIRAVQAQAIVPGAETQTMLTHPGGNPNQFDITGGTHAGNNLFHSFQQFGLSQGQTATFLSQPAIQNILGRITGGNASLINGVIQVSGSNANLFLVNPAGILFGPHARLNVPASFLDTTANGIWMGNGWFNATGPNTYATLTGTPESFAFSGPAGAILNAGVLTATPGQTITLLGGVVVNTGTIAVPGGIITIAAVPGQRLVRISQEGSLLSLVLPTTAVTALNAPTNAPLSLPALLTGGMLPAATGMTVEDSIVRLTSSGSVIPTTAGAATVSGALSVASTTLPNAAQIQLLGDRVSLLGANLNASGVSGGTMRIGGDYQGGGTVPNARFTDVDAKTIMRADAIAASPNGTSEPGNGGTVIVWSTDTTRFAGTITAQGGSNGGNGGLVETSGQQTLVVAPSASVSTHAANGQTGTWLLDPPVLTVGTAGPATLSGGPPLTNTPTTATTISPATIVSGLNGNHVNLQASNSITVNAAIDASGNPLAGDLTLTTPTTTLNQPITLAPGSTLSGTATTVKVNVGAIMQNGVDVVAAGGTVNVAAGTFNVPGVTNQVSIRKSVTVQGAGAGNTIVNGGGNSRGVYVDPGTGNTVTLDGLTIQHGYVVGNGAGLLVNSGTVNLTNSTLTGNYSVGSYNSGSVFGGGGIYNAGNTLNLNNSTLAGNAAGGGGGGIWNAGNTLNLTNSSLSGNSAFNGGGIWNDRGTVTVANTSLTSNAATNNGGGINNNYGTVTVANSTLSGNSANNGGGIINWGGTVTVANSTLSGNSAFNGGGISNQTGFSFIICCLSAVDYSTLTVTNSTLSGNSANNGGGIYNDGRFSYGQNTVNLTNSTLSNNAATSSGGGINNGGVVDTGNGGIVNLGNSIVASNTSPLGPDLYGAPVNSQGYNLIGNTSGSSGFVSTDLLNINPRLAPLGNYGGTTQTHALLPGSPAINAGDPSLMTPDQRGFARVGRADIGAFEFQGLSLPPFTLPPFTLPPFTLTDGNQIAAILLGWTIEPITIHFQPLPASSLLCVVRSQSEAPQAPDLYPGIPNCLP